VQFATFPETIVPYYPYFSFVQRPFEMGVEHLRPRELLSLLIDRTPASYTHELDEHHELVAVEEVDHVRI
jgi:nitrilase